MFLFGPHHFIGKIFTLTLQQHFKNDKIKKKLYLNLNSIAKTAVKDHIYSCSYCTKSDLSKNNFKVIKRCNTSFEAKVYFCKKFNSTLNRQLYPSGSSFQLNAY